MQLFKLITGDSFGAITGDSFGVIISRRNGAVAALVVAAPMAALPGEPAGGTKLPQSPADGGDTYAQPAGDGLVLRIALPGLAVQVSPYIHVHQLCGSADTTT